MKTFQNFCRFFVKFGTNKCRHSAAISTWDYFHSIQNWLKILSQHLFLLDDPLCVSPSTLLCFPLFPVVWFPLHYCASPLYSVCDSLYTIVCLPSPLLCVSLLPRADITFSRQIPVLKAVKLKIPSHATLVNIFNRFDIFIWCLARPSWE